MTIPDNYEFTYAGKSWCWRRRDQKQWHGPYPTHDEAVAAAKADAQMAKVPETIVEDEGTEQSSPVKGHWPKGKSRNLDPSRVQVARNLADLLRRAIERPWRHPTLGVLSYRIVGEHLKVDHTTVSKWCKGKNLMPLWACDVVRALLKEFKP